MSNLSDFLPKTYPGLSISSLTLQWVQSRPVWLSEATDTTAGAEAYPQHVLKTDRNVAGAGASIVWQAQNATPAFVNHAKIAATIDTLTVGAEASSIKLTYLVAGALKSLVLSAGAASPDADGNQTLGVTAIRWGALYVGNGTVLIDAVIAGSAGVLGTKSNHGLNFKTNDTVRGGFDALGNFALKKGFADQSASLQVPVTSFSITIGAGVGSLLLNPAGTLAAGTITMPAAPVDGQIVRLSTTQTITALTLSPNAGQTISGAVATLTAAAPASYQYNAASSIWFHVT